MEIIIYYEFMFDMHALMEGKRKVVKPPVHLNKYFQLWKELAEKEGTTNFDYESFAAGYIIGNNIMLKQKMLDIIYKRKQIEEVFK